MGGAPRPIARSGIYLNSAFLDAAREIGLTGRVRDIREITTEDRDPFAVGVTPGV
jgi:hypothetical protein